jgi:ubiquinone/menaquinone biosynthesis C-methylase UbiE
MRRNQHIRSRVLGTAFNLLYNQFAWAYDWVSHSAFRGQWRTWQRAVLPRLQGLPGRAVLEIGSGTGDLLYDLRAGFQPAGIDLSPAMLGQTRRKARRRGILAQLRLARARTQALPFAGASFAAVVSTFPSDYIADPRTIAEIARVLQPGGRLIVVLGARLLPTDRTNRLLERFADIVYGVPPQREQVLKKIMAETIFPELLPRLRAGGFEPIEHGWQRFPTSVAYIVAAKREA